MKTLVCTAPGQFIYRSVDHPIVDKGSSIIKIKRIGICGTDLHAYEGTQPFFNYPRVLGHELSGELVDIDDAPGFSVGETVTFIPYFNCNDCIACRSGKPNCCVNLQVSGVHADGGMVEYLSVPSYSLVHGENLALDDLALVEPLAIGAHAVKRAFVQPGEYVLVVGAGPIGLGIMEFARNAGAKVIAMDINPSRLALCQSALRIEYTINAAKEDVQERLCAITHGDMPTVVMDATGNQQAINKAFLYMAHGARYVLVGLQKGNVCLSHPEFHKRESSLMSSRNATREDFEFVIEKIKKGEIDPSRYITHRVMFEDLKDEFPTWLNPDKEMVKTIVELND